MMVAIMLLPLFTSAQTINYSCSFENATDTTGWVLLGSGQTNYWTIGSGAHSTGSRAMYICSTDTASNTYNSAATSVSYAYRTLSLTAGSYAMSFDWRVAGESNYDYLRVFLAPSTANLAAGVSSQLNPLPTDWYALDGNTQRCGVSSWQTFSTDFNLPTDGTYNLVFMWVNDGSVGTNPPAAVDNVNFRQLTCATPINPRLDNVGTTSVDLMWTDNNASAPAEWLIEIDTLGQVRGTGIEISAYDTMASISGLTSGTTYIAYIYAICSSSDTSMFAQYSFTTLCTPLESVPYTQDFETSTAVNNSNSTTFVNCWNRLTDAVGLLYPYVGNGTNYSHGGGTNGLYWVHGTSSASGTYQLVVLPGIDTDIVDIRQMQLTFWGRSTSVSYMPTLQVGVMTNPYDAATFSAVSTVRFSSVDWTRVAVDFADIDSGSYIAIMATGSTLWYGIFDDFRIDFAPTCPNMGSIAVDVVGTTGASLSWTVESGAIGTVTGYEIIVDSAAVSPSAEMPELIHDTALVASYLVTGLQPTAEYRVRIRPLCEGENTVEWAAASFTTIGLPCSIADTASIDTIVFSNGTVSTSGVPVNSSWGNTLCQSIYTASELNAMGIYAGQITGFDYTYTTNSSYAKVFSAYMTTTDMQVFHSAAEMVPVRAADLVYGPASHPLNTSGVRHYELDTPFNWDGSSSLVITTFMNQPNGQNHTTSSFYGYSTLSSGNHTVYRYQDNNQYTPSNSTAGSGVVSTYRPSITFYTQGCLQLASCAAPTLIVDRVDVDTVSISWIPGLNESSWSVYYRIQGDADWTTEATGIADNAYTFTTLQPMHTYQIRVVPDCGGDSVSGQVFVTTPCVPVATLPFTENFESFVATSTYGTDITSCWYRGSNYTSTGYPYRTTSYAHGGLNSMYFASYGGSYYTYLALPAMAVGVDSLQVSFAAYKTAAGYNIMVGVMTDPFDWQTFTPVDTVSPANISEWAMFEIPFSSYSGDNGHIALACTGNTYMYVDDIEVSRIPSCPRPSNVTFSNITTSNATVHWTSPSGSFIHEIEYGPAGFAHGAGTVVTSSIDSVTLYGLAHSSPYDVYVRSQCSAADTSNWSFVATFNTDCGIIDNLPYIQNFSGWGVGTGHRPACWACGGYSSYPYIVSVTNNDATTQALYLYTYSSNQTYASLPELDSITYPVTMTQVVFRAWSTNFTSTSYTHQLVVGACSTQGDLSTFIPQDTIILTDAPAIYEASFDTMPLTHRYITFVSSLGIPASPSYTVYYNPVYIDTVSLQLLPDCQTPNQLHAANVTSNSAELLWNDRNSSLNFQVEYGPYGFELGSGTRLTVSSSPISVSALSPATIYQFYVRSICGVGDTSAWALTPGRFTTLQNPASVPYFCDFESESEWANWQTNSNTTINWYRDTAAGNGTNGLNTTGRYSMFVSADTGRSYSTNLNAVVNATAYRDIDFGTVDSSYLLSFRAKAGGTTTNGYDGLMVFLVDPYADVVASNANITTPWGNINDMTYLTFVRCNTNWNTYSVILDTLVGVHRLAFYWFNQATGTTSFIGGPGAIDDINIDYIACPRPAGVRGTNITTVSADVVWHGPANADYRVSIRNATGSVISSDLVHTNSIHYNMLNPGSRYNVYVRRLCSDSDSSQLSLAGTFYTLICNDGHNDTIGYPNSTTTTKNLPVTVDQSYSYTQQILLASELGGRGDISAINFKYTYATALPARSNCTIYMGHTSRSSFRDIDSYVSPDSLQIVYTGSLTCSEGWNRFILNSPFEYNGYDNLVIAVDDNSRAYFANNCFAVDQTSSLMSLAYYSSTQNPNPASNASLDSFDGSKVLYGYRNIMYVESCPVNSCPRPILREPIIRPSSVTIRWRNTGFSYQVGYRRSTTTSWIYDNVIVDDTFYTITGLSPNTEYTYHVRQYCDTTNISNYSQGTFNPSNIPCLAPMGLRVTNVTNNKVTLYWNPEENNISYHLHVWNSYFNQTKNAYVAHGSISGLDANTVYYAAVQAVCQGFEDPSTWSDTISFTTDVCPDVTNLTFSDVQGNSVVLDWTEGGRAEQWEIEFGYSGFVQGQGNSIIVDHHPYTLDILIGDTPYDVYVRALCDADFHSEHWSNKVSFNTLYSAISNISDDARILLFPNPTDGDVQLTLPEAPSSILVEVIDLAGRTLHSQSLAPGTEHTVLPTSQLAPGAYYVRITADNIHAIKKLMVR